MASEWISVFYGGEVPTVEYIELSCGVGLRALYRGVDVFTTKADELVRFLSRDAAYDDSDWELGYTYTFPDLDLSLWRPMMPESPNDPEGQYFSTIGVGVRGYFRRKTQ